MYLKQLTLSETIEKVESLIDNGNGDAGRLYHILEFLKTNRTLYHSDQVYLENKLQTPFSVEDENVGEEQNILLPKIQHLIDSGIGDPGRLQHIYDMLANGKHLYQSDELYLKLKLNSPNQIQKINPESQIQKIEIIPPPKVIPLESKPQIKTRRPPVN